jgi:hypothetical protein
MAVSANRPQSRSYRRLWVLWVLATVVGCCLGVILPTALLARTEFGTSLSDPLTGTRWWALGLGVGAAQAMALYLAQGKSRHGSASALLWAAGTVIGWGVSYWPGGWGGHWSPCW